MNIQDSNQKFAKFLQLLFLNADYIGVIKECNFFLKKNTGNSSIYNFLGLSEFKLEKYNELIVSFKKALSLDKENHLILQNLFYSYLKLSMKFFALKSALKIIKFNPEAIEIYLNIYHIFSCTKSKKKILKKLIKNVNFNQTNIPSNLFNFLINNQEYEFGILICRSLLKNKKNYKLLNLLGQFYFLNEDTEFAKQSHLESIDIKNDYCYSYYDLAEVFKTEGNLIEAKINYKKAIKYNIEKIDGELHRAFSSVHKYKSLNDQHIIEMQNLIISENVDEKNRILINFALAKSYEDIKEFELSYKSFDELNKNYFKLLNYSSEPFVKEVDIFKKFYLENKKKLTSKKIGSSDASPIFIIGLPRSGSTLVEQIISSHSQVTSYGKSKALGQSLSTFFNVFDLNIFQQQLNKVSDDFYYKIGKEYLLRIIKDKKIKIFTDKMLFNFCYLGLIKFSLPKAKIIYCKRDYRDIFLSIYKNFFSENKMGFSYDKKELINFISLFDENINFWKNELKNYIFTLNYENLIANSECEVSRILKFCDLQWEDKCLAFYENKSKVRTVSSAQVRQNFYSSSVSLWRHYEKFFFDEFNQLTLLMNKSKEG